MNTIYRLLLVLLLPIVIVTSSVAQSPTPPSRSRTENLESILRSINKLNRDLELKQAEIRSPSGEGRREEITKQIQDIVGRLDQMQSNFEEIASGVDADAFVAKSEETSVDWTKDLQEILSPIVNEIRRLTRRPREIDRLRSAIEDHEAQLQSIDHAQKNLRKLTAEGSTPELAQYLEKVSHDFDARRQSTLTHLGIARQRLESKLSERKTLSESVQNIFQLFFKSRGVNLILAVLCAFGFWLIARRVQMMTAPLLSAPNDRGFYSRLVSVLFTISAVIGAIIVFLLSLYFVGDWVLLILTLMLILGILWTSKQAVHQFWTHATLLLNMGSTREGERIVYNGLPWKVESLNFYTHLVNPALKGGSIFLPIRDMSSYRSRAYDASEPWFITSEGDWILFPDNTIARVIHQSIEQVQVVFLGGSTRTYLTPQFLAEPLKNISRGFRHSLSFGVDYELQDNATDKVPEKLKEGLIRGLSEAGYTKELKNITVEFEEAAASSLNMAIIADFDGTVASDYNKLRRLMLKLCVDACNKHGWIIPFNQMTVHVAKD